MSSTVSGGCSCGGYYTEGCRVYRCCRERGLAHCGLCAEVPCAGLAAMRDFRDLDGEYDKIVSIEMMEALGHRYQPAFAEVVARGLAPQGRVARRKAGYASAIGEASHWHDRIGERASATA